MSEADGGIIPPSKRQCYNEYQTSLVQYDRAWAANHYVQLAAGTLGTIGGCFLLWKIHKSTKTLTIAYGIIALQIVSSLCYFPIAIAGIDWQHTILTRKQYVVMDYTLIFVILLALQTDYHIAFRYLISMLKIYYPKLVWPTRFVQFGYILIFYACMCYIVQWVADFLITTQFSIKSAFIKFFFGNDWGMPPWLHT